MFSADNTGLIIVWKTSVNDGNGRQPCHRWCIEKVQTIFGMFDLNACIIKYALDFSDSGLIRAEKHTHNKSLMFLQWKLNLKGM